MLNQKTVLRIESDGAGGPLREVSSPWDTANVSLLPTQALVAPICVGICNTDVTMHRNGVGDFGFQPPLVLGHESVARVLRVSTTAAEQLLSPNDIVIVTYASCGDCRACKNHRPGYCKASAALNLGDGQKFFGQSAFATQFIVNTNQLIPVSRAGNAPPKVPAAVLPVLACSGLTAAGVVQHVLAVGPSDTLLVTGCGAVGLLALLVARHVCDCKNLVCLDMRPEAVACAVQLVGAKSITLEPGKGLTARHVRKHQVTKALDTTAVASVVQALLAGLLPGGHVVSVGLPAQSGHEVSVDLQQLATRGVKLSGSVEGDVDPAKMVPALIGWLEKLRAFAAATASLIDVAPFSAASVTRAFGGRLRPGALKPVLALPDALLMDKFAALLQRKAPTNDSTGETTPTTGDGAQALFRHAWPIRAPVDIFGVWRGGSLDASHEAHAQLTDMQWGGKQFISADKVRPFLVASKTAKNNNAKKDTKEEEEDPEDSQMIVGDVTLTSSDVMGSAKLRLTPGPAAACDGALSVAMHYEEHPVVDHFRALGPDTLIGCMVTEGQSDYYFYLERHVVLSPQRHNTVSKL